MQEYAKSHDGVCLSTEYKGLNHPLKWQCKKGHMWNTTPGGMIFQNSWCKKCAGIDRGIKRRIPIERAIELAKHRGGELISKVYVNSHTKLKWRCKEGHIFEACYSSVKYMNSWCPICTSGINERICREYFKVTYSPP